MSHSVWTHKEHVHTEANTTQRQQYACINICLRILYKCPNFWSRVKYELISILLNYSVFQGKTVEWDMHFYLSHELKCLHAHSRKPDRRTTENSKSTSSRRDFLTKIMTWTTKLKVRPKRRLLKLAFYRCLSHASSLNFSFPVQVFWDGKLHVF